MSTVQFPAGYIEKIATRLQEHSTNLPRGVKAAQNYMALLSSELLAALENSHAAQPSISDGGGNSITIEWCEANLAFAVCRAGDLVECFPTHAEAKRFANEIITEVCGETAAAQPCD